MPVVFWAPSPLTAVLYHKTGLTEANHVDISCESRAQALTAARIVDLLPWPYESTRLLVGDTVVVQFGYR